MMTHEEMEHVKKCMAKVAEKNFNRVKDKLLEDAEMPLMERKAMMSIAKNAAKLMAYAEAIGEPSHEHYWAKI